MLILRVGVFVATVLAQQVYVSTTGTSTRPYCAAPAKASADFDTPSYHYSTFSYTQTETVRTATCATLGSTTTYAVPYSKVSNSFSSLVTTSWGNWNPDSTATATDTKNPYGHAAYTSLWEKANITSFTRGLYSTTVSPTPVPTSELVLPPPQYFRPHDCYKFPKDFVFGVAAAAVQIEGAIADEGRSPAFPDIFTGIIDEMPTYLLDEITGGSAAVNDYTTNEHYYLYKQDIERLAAMGVEYYSFTIPWSRILPFVLPGTPVNSQALNHYNDLINLVISKGMRPIITLLHTDTPLVFFGDDVEATIAERAYFGSLNAGYGNATFEDAFVNYGKIVMAHFADRVPFWFTINEPQNGATSGPSIDNIIKAHARLYHFYKDNLHGTGKISMKMGGTPGAPQNPKNASHIAATQHYNDFYLGPFLNPLTLGIDYPEAYKMTIQDYIPLALADLKYLKGTIDFIAFDGYTTPTIYPVVNSIATCAANNATSNSNYPTCVGSTFDTVNGWEMGYHTDYVMYSTPTYLRSTVNYLWNTYKKPVMLSEYGFPMNATSFESTADALNDLPRSEYYQSYMTEILKSIWEDGVDVMGSLAWSWVDNWEFGSYNHQFGLQAVDRDTMERSYKRSFFDLVDFYKTRKTH
ncbi:glycoside hydrolase family 1 protein [Penicillium verhagenii]|uniref:glycoside hydrolase family 1 protein n=1 Tax=Penicillium verhagenii TaxID=1562060 RepID=UPI002544DEE0|nr:glycoside hydrolase family 1 protein [Penicillium verhagenii]KAJ5919315.1 glycoside hydrolase family 1 protein [Penicillium verhagenii]